MNGPFTGTGPLLRVTVRQNIGLAVTWAIVIAGLSASSIFAFLWVYDDDASRAALAATVGANPALSMLFGPARELMTADGFNAWRSGTLGAYFAGLMAILLVVRTSRADEDSGQAELLASAVLGRHARLSVSVLTAVTAALFTSVLTWIVTVLAGGGALATLLLAATFTASGLVFAAVAAVAAQLGSDARSASAIGVTVLSGLYLLRGYLDAGGAEEWTSWLTPFGWFENVRPGTGNNPWPLLLAVVAAALLGILAVFLQSRRDFGQGIVPPRPGPARAGYTGTLWGFVLRLHATSIVSWLIAFAVLGVVLGTLTTSIGGVLTENPLVAQVIATGAATEAGLVFEFVVTILRLLGMIAAVMGVQLVTRAYNEELDLRAEPLLATAVSRVRHLGAHALPAFLTPALALLLGGVLLAPIVAGGNEGISAGEVLTQTVATIPATLFLIALTFVAVGAWPAVRAIGWAAIGTAFVLTILGPMLDLDERPLQISPFWHVPSVTAAESNWAGLQWISAITILLIVSGFAGYRRRDVL